MTRTRVWIALVTFTVNAIALAAIAAPRAEIRMYGATWCGPCGAVKTFLTQNGVPFTYLDVDDPAAREAFLKESPEAAGIPLLVVGGEKIRGANMVRIRAALEKAGALKGAPAPPAAAGVETWGGHAAAWWQAQFRALRAQVADAGQKITELEKVAADHYEKEVLAKMKEDRKILQASLDQLENDASNLSVPRKYRE